MKKLFPYSWLRTKKLLPPLCMFAMLIVSNIGYATDPSISVFTAALIDGEASAPLPLTPEIERMGQAMQERTLNTGPIIVKAKRVLRFQQQPQCGRIVFFIAQPDSGTEWKDLGGQLNICEDGTPPWRVCKNDPHRLIPPDGTCSDHSPLQDTAEVTAAIKAALASGNLSPEQVKETLKNQSSSERGQK
ncbi:MAG: hypothetical protein IT497_04335 [Ottowia sp.]|jgi:hypothetical protein|nr:hypothetical protein [Ottowia sp.]